MNNKGQSLVLFVLIIPILLGIMALVYDVGMIYNHKMRQRSIIELSLYLNEDEFNKNDIENILVKNLNNTKINVSIVDNIVEVDLEENVDGVFSKIFGFSIFTIRSKYSLYKELDDIVIKEIK